LHNLVANYLRIIGYVSLLAAALLLLTAWYCRLNRRLRLEITARREAETRLRQMSETDALTGLHNLRYINEQLSAELARYQRYGHEFCVVMLDIDFFKAVNDNWGHPAGDRVLQQFAQRLQEKTRHTDTLARIGGEEFLILLRNVSLEQARVVAEGMRQHIESSSFDLGQSTPSTVDRQYRRQCGDPGDRRSQRTLFSRRSGPVSSQVTRTESHRVCYRIPLLRVTTGYRCLELVCGCRSR